MKKTLITVLLALVIIMVGCSRITLKHEGTEVKYTGGRKDLENVYLELGDMKFRAGSAVTAPDPYEDLLNEAASALICERYPLLPKCKSEPIND